MDIKSILPIVIQISLILIVASIGLQSQWRDLIYAIRRPALLLRGFIAVYIFVPVVAIALVTLLPLEPMVKIGIVAMAVSPLAPFAPGKMLKAGAGTTFVVGVYVGLLVLALVAVPLTLTLLGLLFPAAKSIGADALAWLILTSVLLPLSVGILLGSWMPDIAARLAKVASLIAYIALAIVLLPVLFTARHQLAALIGNGALVAIVLTTMVGLTVGHLLGGPDPHHRVALAQAAATRHPGIAGLIVHTNISDQRAMLAVVLYLLVSIAVCALYSKWALKRVVARDAPAPGITV